MEELSASDESATDAVAEVQEDEGLVWKEVGGCVGLVAEGEGLDFLDGAGGGVEEVGESVEEAGLFDDGEVWGAEDAVGLGVEDAWDADEEDVGVWDSEAASGGVGTVEEGLDGAWRGEGDCGGLLGGVEGLEHDGGGADAEFDDGELAGGGDGEVSGRASHGGAGWRNVAGLGFFDEPVADEVVGDFAGGHGGEPGGAGEVGAREWAAGEEEAEGASAVGRAELGGVGIH